MIVCVWFIIICYRYNGEGKHGSQPPRTGGQPFQPPADLRQVGQAGIVKTTWKFFTNFILFMPEIIMKLNIIQIYNRKTSHKMIKMFKKTNLYSIEFLYDFNFMDVLLFVKQKISML